jgi:hypothetical protein
MKRIVTILILAISLAGSAISCSAPQQTKKGLTKEQRDRMDKDKIDFEKKLPDDNG